MAKEENEKGAGVQVTDDFEDMLRQSISPGIQKEPSKKEATTDKGDTKKDQSASNEKEVSDPVVQTGKDKEVKGGKKKRVSEGSELDFILSNPANIDKPANVKIDEVKLKKIKKYVTILGGQGTSIQSYIDNILTLHFQAHEQELNTRSQQQL